MNKIVASLLSVAFMSGICLSQDPQKPPQQIEQEDVVRITTELVQTDVVVTDNNEHPVTDLKLEDFEVFDRGKKQDLKFAELVTIDTPQKERIDPALKIRGVDTSVARELTARDVRRVTAFVVDDVTIPSEDMARARQMLTDFVNNKMTEGDLVAIVRTVGGKGLLEQFTADKQILRRAISQLGVRSVPPYLAFTDNDNGSVAPPSSLEDSTATQTINSTFDFEGPNEGTNQVPRAMLALSVSNYVIDSLRQVPGRKRDR